MQKADEESASPSTTNSQIVLSHVKIDVVPDISNSNFTSLTNAGVIVNVNMKDDKDSPKSSQSADRFE